MSCDLTVITDLLTARKCINTNQRFGEQKGQDHHERLLSNKLGELQNKYEEMTGSAELELPKHCVTAARLLVDAKLLSNIL